MLNISFSLDYVFKRSVALGDNSYNTLSQSFVVLRHDSKFSYLVPKPFKLVALRNA